ncbi:hypothetical protein AWC38_SpisGene5585 [Stylophora pistillata]|uniref:Uncharacterized protein n=1 Tax=Stylophora pistillata TaxID=50429 RepID=A0A2B4SMM7_STYPI|nr:hypothetical protein AWC38_SpisGene5585 [Stylophora pistillata]
MASNKIVSFDTEGEFEEINEEISGLKSGEGEEAGRGLIRNNTAWKSCDKKKYHQRYIPLKHALGFRELSTKDKESFASEKGLTEEDKVFLSSEEAVKLLQNLSDAVVCITVGKPTSLKSAYGTGFLVRVNNENAVITNPHSIRESESGDGIDFRLVEESDVRVHFFHDGKRSAQISRDVTRIESASPPDKNKDKNVLLKSMKRQLRGDEVKDTSDINKCDIALGLLSSYFNRRDAFLDYALLYMKPLEKDEQTKFENVRPLEMKEFSILENFRNVSSFGFPDPGSSKYPRSLRLFTISHPHQASKQVSFRGMESNLTHVYFLNMAYGQNDTGMLGGKEPFAEHSITTCKGSSGAPIFLYIFNHDTGEVILDEGVYFLHFYGQEVDGDLRGKAVLFSTIIPNLDRQATHKELAKALAQRKKKVE